MNIPKSLIYFISVAFILMPAAICLADEVAAPQASADQPSIDVDEASARAEKVAQPSEGVPQEPESTSDFLADDGALGANEQDKEKDEAKPGEPKPSTEEPPPKQSFDLGLQTLTLGAPGSEPLTVMPRPEGQVPSGIPVLGVQGINQGGLFLTNFLANLAKPGTQSVTQAIQETGAKPDGGITLGNGPAGTIGSLNNYNPVYTVPEGMGGISTGPDAPPLDIVIIQGPDPWHDNLPTQEQLQEQLGENFPNGVNVYYITKPNDLNSLEGALSDISALANDDLENGNPHGLLIIVETHGANKPGANGHLVGDGSIVTGAELGAAIEGIRPAYGDIAVVSESCDTGSQDCAGIGFIKPKPPEKK